MKAAQAGWSRERWALLSRHRTVSDRLVPHRRPGPAPPRVESRPSHGRVTSESRAVIIGFNNWRAHPWPARAAPSRDPKQSGRPAAGQREPPRAAPTSPSTGPGPVGVTFGVPNIDIGSHHRFQTESARRPGTRPPSGVAQGARPGPPGSGDHNPSGGPRPQSRPRAAR